MTNEDVYRKCAIRLLRRALTEAFISTREATPKDTIYAMRSAGYSPLEIKLAVGQEVNLLVENHDGRVSRANAERYKECPSGAEIEADGFYYTHGIHPTNLDQIASALAEYMPHLFK